MAYRRRRPAPRYKRRAVSAYTPRTTRRQPARRASKRRAASRKCVCPPTELDPGLKFALAQIQPFDVQCQGAKIPDSNTMPSIATSDTEIIGVASVVGSLTATAFRPSYTWGTVPATAGIGAVTWGVAYATNALDRTNRTAYLALVELARPTAHALRLTCSLAPTSTSGFVHIGISNESSYNKVTWQYPTTIAQMSGLQHYKRITLASLTQTPYVVINKWIDDTGFRYRAPDSNLVETASHSTFQSDGGWGTIIILLEGVGVASTSALSVEHLLLTESIPDKAGVMHGTSAARDSPSTIGTASAVSQNTEVGHSEAEEQGFVTQALNTVAQAAAEQGVEQVRRVAAPIMRAAGRYAAGVAYGYMSGRMPGLPGINAGPTRLAIE